MQRSRFIILVIGLAVAILPVSAQSQRQQDDHVRPVSFNDAIKIMDDADVASAFDRSDTLAKEVDRRGVGFPLTQNVKMVLTQKGATTTLLTTIGHAAEKRRKKIDSLYDEFNKESQDRTNIEARRRAITLGRELRDMIGDPDLLIGSEKDLREVVRWLNDNLPKMEAKVAAMSKGQKEPY